MVGLCKFTSSLDQAIMSKDEVIRFLQLVKYYEAFPINKENSPYRRMIKYCRWNELVTVTPDDLCMLSSKGVKLLKEENRQVEPLSLLEVELQRKDESVKATYWLAGAAVCVLVFYEIFVKGYK